VDPYAFEDAPRLFDVLREILESPSHLYKQRPFPDERVYAKPWLNIATALGVHYRRTQALLASKEIHGTSVEVTLHEFRQSLLDLCGHTVKEAGNISLAAAFGGRFQRDREAFRQAIVRCRSKARELTGRDLDRLVADPGANAVSCAGEGERFSGPTATAFVPPCAELTRTIESHGVPQDITGRDLDSGEHSTPRVEEMGLVRGSRLDSSQPAPADAERLASSSCPRRVFSRVSAGKFLFAGNLVSLSPADANHLERLWKDAEGEPSGKKANPAERKREDRIRTALRKSGATRNVFANRDEASLILDRGRLCPDYTDHPLLRHQA
jgi:hypothetical protein